MNYRKFLMIFCFALGLGSTAILPAEELDRTVAIANDDVIMASELALQVNMLAYQIQQAGQPMPPKEILQKQVLEKLIVESLQLQLGERAGVKVGKEQLDAAVASIAAQNRMSVPAFEAELKKSGMSVSLFRENVRRQIIIQQVQQALVIKRIDITEQEVDDFLKSEEGRRMAMQGAADQPVSQIHARHILIETSVVRSDEEAKTLLEKIAAAIEKGGSFDALAKKYSDDPGSASKGGDLGWISPGQMVPEFEQVLAKTGIGDVSAPFRSQYGWHLLQPLEKREENMSEKILRQQAQMILRKRQFQDELPRWLKELRDQAYVQIKL